MTAIPKPPAEVSVDSSLVRALLEEQHDDLASLALVDIGEGWDNRMFRLGGDLAVRIPRRAASAALIEHEQRWLPQFGAMDTTFVEMVRQNIYDAKVNALIPLAFIQTDTWTGGNPNPGTAFWVDGKGDYTIEPGYYLLKQLSRAGQAGMAVAEVSSSDPDIQLIAFARDGTAHPDAFVVFSLADRGTRDVRIRLAGTQARAFDTCSAARRPIRFVHQCPECDRHSPCR